MDVALIAAFEQFRDAVASHDAAHADPSPDGQGALITTADDIVRTRAALYELLVSDGWTPPVRVARELAQDALLLAQQDDRWPQR